MIDDILSDDGWKCNYPNKDDKREIFWEGVSKTFYRKDDVLGMCLDEMLDGTFQISRLCCVADQYEVYEKFNTFEEAELYFNLKYL